MVKGGIIEYLFLIAYGAKMENYIFSYFDGLKLGILRLNTNFELDGDII